MKLDVLATGLAFGIIWALGVFLFGVINIFTNWGLGLVEGLGTVYLGYGPTLLGSIAGAIWGFVDAGLGGAAFAWLYNKFAK